MHRFNTKGGTVVSTKEVTQPSNNIVETKQFELIADSNRSDMDSGHLYGFMIVFKDKGGNVSYFEKVNSHFDPDMREYTFFGDPNLGWVTTEYFFCMPPQNIILNEPTTTVIQPTMGRTYVVERQGILLRNLAISGTTGFRPAIGSFTIDLLRKNQLDARGISINEKTGYFNFMQLRNLFRYYEFLHSNPSYVKKWLKRDVDVTLLWVNFHECEFWEAVPRSFNTTRAAASPLTFRYDIQCTLLRKYDSISFAPPDWLPGIFGWVARQIDTAIEFVDKLNEYLGYINYAVAALSGVKTIHDKAAQLARKVLDTAYTSTSASYKALATVPAILIDQCRDSYYDYLSDSEAFVSSLPTGTNAYYEGFMASSSVFKISRILDRLACMKKDSETKPTVFRNPGYSPNTREYPDFDYSSTEERSSVAGSYIVDRVYGNETIFDIARRTLGNEELWETIVLLNNLIPPYISNYSNKLGVLTPGDEILIPANDVYIEENSVFPTDAGEFASIAKDAALAKQLYGTDIKVNLTGYGGIGYPKVDLAIENGDLALVSGSNNFVQAMELKINTEQGALKLHPWYGRVFLTGLQNSLAIVSMAALSFKQCVLADPRVMDVDNFKVNIDQDAVYIEMDVVGERSLARASLVTKEAV